MIQFGTLEELYRVSSTRMIKTTRDDDKGLEDKVNNEHENCKKYGPRLEETPVQRLVENQEHTIDGQLHGGKDEQKIVDELWKLQRSKSYKNYRSRSKNISIFSYNKFSVLNEDGEECDDMCLQDQSFDATVSNNVILQECFEEDQRVRIELKEVANSQRHRDLDGSQ